MAGALSDDWPADEAERRLTEQRIEAKRRLYLTTSPLRNRNGETPRLVRGMNRRGRPYRHDQFGFDIAYD